MSKGNKADAKPAQKAKNSNSEKSFRPKVYKEFGRSAALGNKTGYRPADDEFLLELKGKRARKVFKEMSDNNPNIAGMLYAIEMLLRSVAWTVEPAEGDTSGEYADFVKSVLEDMDFTMPEIVTEILTMLPFGFSVLEMVFKTRSDGKLGIKKLAPRPQLSIDRFECGKTGEILGVWQSAISTVGGKSTFIPYSKVLHFRTKLNGNNPEGKSLLRGAYTSYYAAKKLNEIEAIAIEREMTGVPIITAPKDEIDDNEGDYEQMGANLKNNSQGSFVIPSDQYLDDQGKPTGVAMYDIKLIAAAGTRSIDIDKSITRHELNILRSLLATFISLGANGGSNALSQDQTDFFVDSCQGYLTSIACEFNEKLWPTLWLLNGYDVDMMPKTNPGKIKKEDVQKVADAWAKFAAAGVNLMDEAAQNHVRSLMGLPPLTPDMLTYEKPADDKNPPPEDDEEPNAEEE